MAQSYDPVWMVSGCVKEAGVEILWQESRRFPVLSGRLSLTNGSDFQIGWEKKGGMSIILCWAGSACRKEETECGV